MGWTSFRMREPVKEWFKREWETGGNYEVVDSALVQRNTLYGAIKKKETGEIFCAVFLVRWSRDVYNFSYKDMTEWAGPGAIDCPEKIFNLLTPLTGDDNGWAAEWRENVKKFHAARKAFNKNKIIKTEREFEFVSGHKFQYFRKDGKYVWGGWMNENEFMPMVRVRLNPTKYRNIEIL